MRVILFILTLVAMPALAAIIPACKGSAWPIAIGQGSVPCTDGLCVWR